MMPIALEPPEPDLPPEAPETCQSIDTPVLATILYFVGAIILMLSIGIAVAAFNDPGHDAQPIAVGIGGIVAALLLLAVASILSLLNRIEHHLRPAHK